MKDDHMILGAGITGLSAGLATGGAIYEANGYPGGICASYYVGLNGKKSHCREDEESYRFEIGGGHWIFGADKRTENFINSLSKVKTCNRNSAVYFADRDLYVPYPLQNHLSYLPEEIARKAVSEIINSRQRKVSTFADWLEASFGKTLCDLFFFPFHELYTAGLYTKIAPQDQYKSPVDKKMVAKGAEGKTPQVGYNAKFIYPENGLDDLIGKMSRKCDVRYEKEIIKIDVNRKRLVLKNGDEVCYRKAISTLALNKVIEKSDMRLEGKPLPYTSVLVINIGARRGKRCPDYHWLYVPKSASGFHRIGFYSNVDKSFLPQSSRKEDGRVSIYIETSFPGGKKPADGQIKNFCENTIAELKRLEFISAAEVVDPTWIDVAYTWEFFDSQYKQKALEILDANGIIQAGRYGKWKFQGIAESIKDGFKIKRA